MRYGEFASWEFPREAPEVSLSSDCACEGDVSVAEVDCGGSCSDGFLGSSLRREVETGRLLGAPLPEEALPAWDSASREDAAGVGSFPAGPGPFVPGTLPDLPPLDGFYAHELERDCDIALAPGEEPGRFCVKPQESDCGGANSYFLEPPDFSSVAFYTQLCFTLSYDPAGWPAHDCNAPCITPMSCELPNFLQLWAANLALPTVVPLDDLDEYSPALGRGLTDDEESYLGAAKALLTANLDLVEWVVCLACSWAPTVPDPDAIIDCITRSLQFGGTHTVYVIQYFLDLTKDPPEHQPATGAATDLHPAPLGGGPGVVIAIEHPTTQSIIRDYTAAIASGDNAVAMATAAIMSTAILHELMHLCAEEPNVPFEFPGLASDRRVCWAIQKMSAISFLWALSQRYPELQNLGTCFPKADDLYFMTSEPGTTDPEQVVDYLFDAGELFPWQC